MGGVHGRPTPRARGRNGLLVASRRSLPHLEPPATAPAWRPDRVAVALDSSRELSELLARHLLPIVVEHAGRELFPWASRYARQSTELRNDVAQDVMLKLFADGGRVLRCWDPTQGLSLRGFIKRVVRFHVLQLFRTERRNPWRNSPQPPQQLDSEGTEDTGAQDLLHQLWLWQVRDQLLERESARGRRLYRALFVEQRPAEDVAGELGMSRDAVYQWSARFKRRAARAFDPAPANPRSEEAP